MLGMVQGITEWLPVSSSGHLVILQHYWGVDSPVLFDALLHLATALTVLLVFRQDVSRIVTAFFSGLGDMRKGAEFWESLWNDTDARMGLLVVLGSVPIGIAGFLLADEVESMFESIRHVAVALLVTGIILISTVFVRGKGRSDASARDAAVVGIVQVASLVPGISRSGSTISAGLHSGLDRETAARFSFLLSIPAIIGASAYQLLKNGASGPGIQVGTSELAGMAAAALVGYACIHTLLAVVRRGYVHLFALYCLALSGVLFLVI